MTDRAEQLAAAALAVVLDLGSGTVRADTPLADVGADSVALVQWADVAEELAAQAGTPVTVDDAALARAVRLGDLADHLRPQLPVTA